MDRQKLIYQLFIGKVADVLGMEKTTKLLKEAKEAFDIPVVVQQSELLACDCDRQPLRYNELGICKYCGKQKPSEG